MAPRRRPKKKNTRMQAALEAMQAYGFSMDLILKKLKELLNVYGEENWLFVEDNSYKVLLDNIIEHVEQEEQQKDDKLAGPSNGVLAACYSDTEALDITLPAIEERKSASQTHATLDAALVTQNSDGNGHLLLTGKETGQKDVNLELNPGEQQDTIVLETSYKNSGCVIPCGSTNLSPPQAIHSEQPKLNFSKRKRKPCNGWICNDKEVNEGCLITLEPTPLPAEFAKLLFGTNIHSRRKTKWDLRPDS